MDKPRKNWGLVAQFDNPAALLRAAHRLREAGYTRWESWSPFPIHGMYDAQKLSGSKVPWLTLGGGLTGFSIGMLLQWWVGSVAYPLVIGGKPLFAWEFAVPVTFELSILLAAFGTVFGMFGLNRLPRPYHPLDKFPGFRKVTDDGFFLSIEVADPKFDVSRSRALLEEIGGRAVTLVEE